MKYLKPALIAVFIASAGWFGFSTQNSFGEMPNPSRPIDTLPTLPWWQTKVTNQATASRGQRYQGCLFGDSISSALGDTLGDKTVNFAIGGLSSVSLVEQLKVLNSANIHCETAIIAIGTNDAWYTTQDQDFTANLAQIVNRVT